MAMATMRHCLARQAWHFGNGACGGGRNGNGYHAPLFGEAGVALRKLQGACGGGRNGNGYHAPWAYLARQAWHFGSLRVPAAEAEMAMATMRNYLARQAWHGSLRAPAAEADMETATMRRGLI
jgi:hypothetical protein